MNLSSLRVVEPTLAMSFELQDCTVWPSQPLRSLPLKKALPSPPWAAPQGASASARPRMMVRTRMVSSKENAGPQAPASGPCAAYQVVAELWVAGDGWRVAGEDIEASSSPTTRHPSP